MDFEIKIFFVFLFIIRANGEKITIGLNITLK